MSKSYESLFYDARRTMAQTQLPRISHSSALIIRLFRQVKENAEETQAKRNQEKKKFFLQTSSTTFNFKPFCNLHAIYISAFFLLVYNPLKWQCSSEQGQEPWQMMRNIYILNHFTNASFMLALLPVLALFWKLNIAYAFTLSVSWLVLAFLRFSAAVDISLLTIFLS